MTTVIAGKCVRRLYGLMHKIIFRMKLMILDDNWYYMGGNCFGLFPPSFYCTHTPEEIEHITAEKMAKLKMMLEELDR